MAKRLSASTKSIGGDQCGCVTAARFLAVGFSVSAVLYLWLWQVDCESFGGALVHILIWSFAAAFLGKVIGVAAFYYRTRSHYTRYEPHGPAGQQHLDQAILEGRKVKR